MKPDCLALVALSNNETLWVRSATFDRRQAAQAWQAVQAQREDPVELVMSHVDPAGAEQFVELLTPWAKGVCRDAQSPAPAMAAVEVWQAVTPTFGFGGLPAAFEKTAFARVADVVVPVAEGAEAAPAALDAVFAATQNIDHAWRPGKPCRSTSVGDVLVYRVDGHSQAFVVDNIGFKPVTFQ